jgi:hypothetical protein
MKTRNFNYLPTLMLFFISMAPLIVFGQKAPIKFGKVSKADLEMKAYPSDTSAEAAVLCNYGYFDATRFDFVRTMRIKIFKKEGTHWGSMVFPLSSKADIKGVTFNLENGEVVESKLKSESIFRERVTDDNYRVRVAMPNVKEGSIIDIEYVHPWLPSEWRFQEEIPVRWSELIIESSPYVDFRKNFFGFERLSESTDTRWVTKDMPAFKKEPYMNAVTNYITKYEIEVLNISIPGNERSNGFFREYCTSWEAVNNRLRESSYFGKAMQGCAFLNSIVKEIEKKYSDPVDKMKAAHEAIKKAIKWNDEEALFSSSENLSSPFNKKIGNSGDINMALIQLLRKLDMDVYPVALSTRSNGFLSPISPSLDKLNYVVAYVVMGDKKYFLDATEEFLPAGMLPYRCLNLQGRLIDEKKSAWIDLTPGKKDKKTMVYNLKLEPDNILTGQLTRADYDYAALDFRKKYEKFNSKEEYLKDFENDNKGLTVSTCDILNLDSIYLPVKETYGVKIKNKVTSAGNLLYINPLLFDQMTSNPFKNEDRKYPVDFIQPIEQMYIWKLTLPEGAQVSELPKPLVIKLPDNSASVQYQIASVGNVIQLTYKFVINKPIFSNEQYADLRMFFSEMMKKHSESVVIKTL